MTKQEIIDKAETALENGVLDPAELRSNLVRMIKVVKGLPDEEDSTKIHYMSEVGVIITNPDNTPPKTPKPKKYLRKLSFRNASMLLSFVNNSPIEVIDITHSNGILILFYTEEA